MAEHLSQSELDYPFKLLEYFNGFRVSKVIFSACELGVFDLLTTSPCALSAQQVAQALHASVDGTERLLDALVGIEILHVETQAEDGTALYSSTEVASMYLAKGGAKSLHDMAIYQSQIIYPLWNNMVDAVREGKNQNQKLFGIPPEEVFRAVYRSDEEMLKFMGLMNSSWVLDGYDVVMAFSLAGFRNIVDLGGDFFHGELPVADLYVLARILHDWSEDKCVTLLKRICDVCEPALYSRTDVAGAYVASLHDMALYQSRIVDPLRDNMVDAVRSSEHDVRPAPSHREGRNQNQKTFGIPPEEVRRGDADVGLTNSSVVRAGLQPRRLPEHRGKTYGHRGEMSKQVTHAKS
ncbi:acetylserotonin O-methyltransferase-like isoform X3 [Phycodurus eques]|uniref:acetylserotonin O-methyltransferase-like isoform X3 n=1 Tax=Phycodurus eques TaxID=693459 RepID=UPI002ACD6373|nr:acetylserotonin O-methyltransferase-like isoform X3 [Phycodurus eques]